jgi:hypothetical protein
MPDPWAVQSPERLYLEASIGRFFRSSTSIAFSAPLREPTATTRCHKINICAALFDWHPSCRGNVELVSSQTAEVVPPFNQDCYKGDVTQHLASNQQPIDQVFLRRFNAAPK